MKFIDEVEINIQSGKGGDGCVGYRREKHVPLGGADGGNGGKGGDVYFQATNQLNTLINFRGKKIYKASPGQAGGGSQCDGKGGEDLYIPVPVGTMVIDKETNVLIADLESHGQVEKILIGGRGGLGNMYFKTSVNQTPTRATEGEPEQVLDIKLELKLLADIALVGLPNAGKSTLISVISAAKPKIADYPFTTLEPNLGVVQRGEDSLVVADIPGLIEDAADGKGLGHKFLKHIERTRAYLHLIDCSMFLEPYEAVESYATIKAELLKFSEKIRNKIEIVCLTKIDAMSDEEIKKFQDIMEEETQRKVLPISSVSRKNVDVLKELLFKAIQTAKENDE